jgi:hypothetical protein
MSEDPKLFDAGDYNLFRYCHNDPIDFTDPMGLQDTVATYSPRQTSQQLADDRAYNFIMGLMQRQFNSAISAGMAGYSAWSALSAFGSTLTTGQGLTSNAAPVVSPKASQDQQAEAVLDHWSDWAYGNRKEVAGFMKSAGEWTVGPEKLRTLTSSHPGTAPADAVATWHFHHLVPGTAPYKFSSPPGGNDTTVMAQYPHLSHYVGVLNAPAGKFTIFAHTPQMPWLHYTRLGPQPFPQPPGY